MKRYTIVITDQIWEQINNVAEERGISSIDVIRRFIRIGLFVWENRDNEIILRDQSGIETRIVILD